MFGGIVVDFINWENVVWRFVIVVVLGIGFGLNIYSVDDLFIEVVRDVSYVLVYGGVFVGIFVDFFFFL